jgi:hypothetical protein
MTRAPRFAFALLVALVTSLSCRADSFTSSASSASSASVGSLSDSVKSASGSSTSHVAEGDYRVVDVAAAERPDVVRLKLQPMADAGNGAAAILVDVPRPALGERASPLGDTVGVRQRPYGYEFAWADTRVAFFLVLAADWQRELEPRPVRL